MKGGDVKKGVWLETSSGDGYVVTDDYHRMSLTENDSDDNFKEHRELWLSKGLKPIVRGKNVKKEKKKTTTATNEKLEVNTSDSQQKCNKDSSTPTRQRSMEEDGIPEDALFALQNRK